MLIGLGALVRASILIGGILSMIALGLARMAGVGDDSGSAVSTEEPSLYYPSPTSSPSPTQESTSEEPTASPSPSPESTEEGGRNQQQRRITLTARPKNVEVSERINLQGTYRRGDGATLQIQRFENGWTDFPVTTTVSGGQFATYIYSGRTGEVRFRVLDESAGLSSQPVTVTIG